MLLQTLNCSSSSFQSIVLSKLKIIHQIMVKPFINRKFKRNPLRIKGCWEMFVCNVCICLCVGWMYTVWELCCDIHPSPSTFTLPAPLPLPLSHQLSLGAFLWEIQDWILKSKNGFCISK